MITNPSINSPLNTSSKDKFLLFFELPYFLRKHRESLGLNSDSLEMTVYGGIVPEITVPAVAAAYQGQTLHVTSYNRPAYSPLNVTFAIDNKYKNYQLLWKWLNLLNDSYNSGYGGTSYESAIDFLAKGDQFEYQTTMSITALDEYNTPIIRFDYLKSFITKLGGINYSYKDANLIECNAEFYFSQLQVAAL